VEDFKFERIHNTDIKPSDKLKNVNEIPSAYEIKYDNPPRYLYDKPARFSQLNPARESVDPVPLNLQERFRTKKIL